MSRRKKVFVDARIQGSLLKRMLLHWVAYFAAVLLILGGIHYLKSRLDPSEAHWGSFFLHNGVTLLLVLALLPIFLHDTLKLTSRFAGPLKRLQIGLEKLADGDPIDPITLRRGDYLGELTNQFNRLRDRIQEAPRESTELPREKNAIIV